MMTTVTIYGRTLCIHCLRAKLLLARHGIAYESIVLERDDPRFAALVARTGMKTVPQIFVGDHFVGGADDLSLALKSGELRSRLM